MLFILRCLTKDERILEGLTTGKDASLVVEEESTASHQVLATADISKDSWLCEFKTTRILPSSAKPAAEEEYKKNNERCCIVDLAYLIPGEGKMLWNATRRYHQLGCYIYYAKSPNAEITEPYWARGKWCISLIVCRDIMEGDEVVWDICRAPAGALQISFGGEF